MSMVLLETSGLRGIWAAGGANDDMAMGTDAQTARSFRLEFHRPFTKKE